MYEVNRNGNQIESKNEINEKYANQTVKCEEDVSLLLGIVENKFIYIYCSSNRLLAFKIWPKYGKNIFVVDSVNVVDK